MQQETVGTAAVVACSLESSSFETRAAEWREVGRHALRRSVETGRVTASYPRDDQLARRLSALIQAESQCCPFLVFEMRERDDRIEVEVTFPPEARGMIETVLVPS